jgi:hypothetical protein
MFRANRNDDLSKAGISSMNNLVTDTREFKSTNKSLQIDVAKPRD